jgi:acetyl-CoA C-acetyltransferase
MSSTILQGAVCLVGTARHTWRDEADAAPEPLGMWEHVARAAIDDVGTTHDVLAELDHLGVVHCQAWAYDDPGHRLAERLGRTGIDHTASIIAGTSPQRLLDAAAERMRRGEISAALVVGAEALATRRRLTKAGEEPAWSYPSDLPPLPESVFREWYLPTELAHGLVPATHTFALLDQARWAARGGQDADRRRMVERFSELSRIAAANPYAWFRTAVSPDELVSSAGGNRPIVTPYRKLMVAFPDVDMAAANLMVTHEVADRWGVPADRRVYLRGWGFERDAAHIAARQDLTSSPAMRAAQGDALRRAGLDVEQVDLFDLYSCFGSAVAFAADALGLADDDPRPLSLTGGLPYHGGPGSNYMGHSISHAVERLRRGDGSVAMVTGVGMHMTKHVAAVYAVEPGVAADAPDNAPQQNLVGEPDADRVVVASADGPVVVRAATVVHGRDGAPEKVLAICSLPDGHRCYAHSAHPDVIAAVDSGAWIEAPARVAANEDGTNELTI